MLVSAVRTTAPVYGEARVAMWMSAIHDATKGHVWGIILLQPRAMLMSEAMLSHEGHVVYATI